MKVQAGFRFYIASYSVIFTCVFIPSEDYYLVSYIHSVHVLQDRERQGI